MGGSCLLLSFRKDLLNKPVHIPDPLFRRPGFREMLVPLGAQPFDLLGDCLDGLGECVIQFLRLGGMVVAVFATTTWCLWRRRLDDQPRIALVGRVCVRQFLASR